MKPKKFLIFDAGPIISLTMNGLLPVLEKLKEEFDGEFIITPLVKKELVDNAMRVKKYELEAVRVKNLIEKGVLKMSSEYMKDNVLERTTNKLMGLANKIFKARGDRVRIIQKGEASCLAFSMLCGCENVIVVDERTTRLLTESPENLKKLMERKLHARVEMLGNNVKDFKNFKYIRSAELLYIAYKKDLLDLKKDALLLDALLYGVKFKGAAISSKEIETIKSLV
jgi:predicted nucleic acid-binding protein